jgi:hypothetical protein
MYGVRISDRIYTQKIYPSFEIRKPVCPALK